MTDIHRCRLENTSVAIVDDHELVLEGFRNFIVKSGLTDVATFSTAAGLLEVMQRDAFDVCIIDVELADMDAPTLIDRIRDLKPDTRIIINTMHEEMWVVNEMTSKQVDGVLYKSEPLSQLTDAIYAVMEGRNYFSKKFKKAQQRLSLLKDMPTQREQQVLEAIAKGYSTKEIGESLYISENTVENHRKSLFRKFQAHNMADLIIKAIAGGYIDPQEIAKQG